MAGARAVAFGGIRLTAALVAVLSSAVGICFTIVSILGPTVWMFSSDGSGAGTFGDLPLPLRIVRSLAVLLPSLTVAVVALLVRDLAVQVRREVRFVPAVSRTTAALAVVVGVGSWLSQIAANVVRGSGLTYAGDVDPSTVDPDTVAIDWGLGVWTLQPNWALLGVAVVLGMLAYIIRAGERLQRETEGLV